MIKKMLIMAAVGLISPVLACKNPAQESSGKFITLPETPDDPTHYLISKIHSNEIKYSLEIVESDCDLDLNKAKALIERQLRNWVNAAKAIILTKESFVDHFTFVTSPRDISSIELFEDASSLPDIEESEGVITSLGSVIRLVQDSNLKVRQIYDLKVFFSCQQGRSVKKNLDHSSMVVLFASKKHMDSRESVGESDGSSNFEQVYEDVFPNSKSIYFSAPILAHEIGHSFGLADTYVRDSQPESIYNISTDGAGNLGSHPDSMMSQAVGRITHDDQLGLLNLYRLLVLEEIISSKSCPFDSVWQQNIGGCIPKYACLNTPSHYLDGSECKMRPTCEDGEYNEYFESCVCTDQNKVLDLSADGTPCMPRVNCNLNSHAVFDKGGGIMACMEKICPAETGMTFNANQNRCSCPPGELFSVEEAACIANQACPETDSFSFQGYCIKKPDCRGGTFNPSNLACSCGQGMVFDPYNRRCVSRQQCSNLDLHQKVVEYKGLCIIEKNCKAKFPELRFSFEHGDCRCPDESMPVADGKDVVCSESVLDGR